MDDQILTSKEKKAIKELRAAMRSLPSKLSLSLDSDNRVIVSKENVPLREFHETITEPGRVVSRDA